MLGNVSSLDTQLCALSAESGNKCTQPAAVYNLPQFLHSFGIVAPVLFVCL
jgi:hypothetical protein